MLCLTENRTSRPRIRSPLGCRSPLQSRRAAGPPHRVAKQSSDWGRPATPPRHERMVRRTAGDPRADLHLLRGVGGGPDRAGGEVPLGQSAAAPIGACCPVGLAGQRPCPHPLTPPSGGCTPDTPRGANGTPIPAVWSSGRSATDRRAQQGCGVCEADTARMLTRRGLWKRVTGAESRRLAGGTNEGV